VGSEIERIAAGADRNGGKPPSAAPALDGAEAHLGAEAFAQHAAQIPDPVDETELQRGASGPDVAVEERPVVGCEPRAPARADELLERRMHVVLDRPQPLDAFRVLFEERIEQALAFPRRVEPSLDAEAVDRLLE